MMDTTYITPLLGILTVLVGIIGWSVRFVIVLIRALRDDLKEYVRRETCRAHREAIERQIDEIRVLLKFGRRYGDSALSEVLRWFNNSMERDSFEESLNKAKQHIPTPPADCSGACKTETE